MTLSNQEQNPETEQKPEQVIPLTLGQLRRLTNSLDDGAFVFVRCYNFKEMTSEELQKTLEENTLGLDEAEVSLTMGNDGDIKEEVYLEIDLSKEIDESTT